MQKVCAMCATRTTYFLTSNPQTMKVHLFLDQRRPAADGRCPVKLSAYWQENGKKCRIFIPTGVSIQPSQWDAVRERDKRSATNNALLAAYLDKVKQFTTDCINNGTQAKGTALRAYLDAPTPTDDSLLAYAQHIAGLKRSTNTKKLYTSTIAKLRAYAGDKADRLTFSDITPTWLAEWDAWMAQTLSINGRAIHLRNLRAVFNAAINDERTTAYPFRRFKVKQEQTRKRSLSVEQLRQLRDYPCEPHHRMYRDIFMLMFYLCGVNAADLLEATPDQLHDGRLEYRRAKTGKLYSVKVEPEAQEIINRYKGTGHLLSIRDRYINRKNFAFRMNHELQEIGEMKRVGRGGKKVYVPLFPDLTAYWSRHTWATIAASLDIPIETISAALGHSYGSPTTAIYIAFDQRKVDDANRRVIDYVNRVTC